MIKHEESSPLTAHLFTILIWLLFVWYLTYLWTRRYLYITSFKLPGPFAFPFIGSAWYFVGKRSKIFGNIMKLFNHYPEVFRMWTGSTLLYMISEPNASRILLTRALGKDTFYKFGEDFVGQGLVTASSVNHWKQHRKMIMPSLRQNVLEGFSPIFMEQSQIFNKVLEKYAGQGEFDLFRPAYAFTLDAVFESAIGVESRNQTSNSKIDTLLERVLETIVVRIYNIFYRNDFLFYKTAMGREYIEAVNQLKEFAKKAIEEKKYIHRDENETHNFDDGFSKGKSFLDHLLDINVSSKEQLSDEELLDETLTFISAGSDTTAAALCFAFTMLGLYQDIQRKVLAEILDVVGPEGKVDSSHLPKLTYLEMVVKETLRLFPVVPIIRRIADEDIDIGTCTVHKGCSIMFGIIKMHRDEKFWPDPLKFDPQRFLPEAVAKRIPGSYIPFSFGPRNCIGHKFAMMLLKTVLATVLVKYQINTSYESIDQIKLDAFIVLKPINGYRVSMEYRQI